MPAVAKLIVALALLAACGGDSGKTSQEPAPAKPSPATPPPAAAPDPAPEPPAAAATVDPPPEPAGAPLPARSRDEIARCRAALPAGNRRCTAIVATGDPLQPGAASKELESATHCFAARSHACACACDRAGAGEGDCNYMTPVDTTDGAAIAICAD